MHGYTPGCYGCVSAQADDGIRRGDHTEACRGRIEQSIDDDRKERERGRMEHHSGDASNTDARMGVASEGESTRAEAQGSGITQEEREKGIEEARKIEAQEEVELEDKIQDKPEGRWKTPERPAAIKRSQEADSGPEAARRRLEKQTMSVWAIFTYFYKD